MSGGAGRSLTVLGLMSGTSVDAIDTALVRFTHDGADPAVLRGEILATGEQPWDPGLRGEILAALPPAPADAGTWCRLHARTGRAFARAARSALGASGERVDLVVSPGQTLFHGVEDGRAWGTLQIGDPAAVAAATGLPVLSDVRSADIAAGGQGAPLVPLLDELLLGDEPSAVLNIGGIANCSIVGAGEVVAGDTGPGNALLDAAVLRASGGREHVDADGRLAARGTVDEALLAALLADPFYALAFPRSTGREHFDADHVDRCATRAGLTRRADLPLEDLLATLVELTARTIARAVADLGRGRGLRRVVGSGGGMRNPVLRVRLAELLDPLPLAGPESAGLPADAKEAVLMALIGAMSAHGLPGVLARADGSAVTGARRPVVLGSWTPAPAGGPALPSFPCRGPVRRLLLPPLPSEETS